MAIGKNIRNTDSGIVITGTAYDDTIRNMLGDKVTIIALGGNNSINSSGDSVSISSGAGDDTIFVGDYHVTIDADAGNNVITSIGGRYVSIKSDAGNDSITCHDDYVTISSGNGNDTIWNTGSYLTITLGSTGNKTIMNDGEHAKIYGGASAKNILYNRGGSYSTILGGAKADSISNYADRVSIDAGKGNDTIYNSGNYNVTVFGGTGADDIYNSGDTVTIDGGSDNDTIWNVASNVTINGNTGTDSITNRGNKSFIDGGDDNDTIINDGFTVTVDGGLGDDIITNKYAQHVTLLGGTGNDKIEIIYGDTISVGGGTGKDYITGNINYGTIAGGDEDDTITGNFSKVKVSGDKGNDFISITDYSGNTLDGGAGADTIAVTGGGEHSINGGTGNDRISLGSAANSIVKFSAGSDTVYGWNSTDTLMIDESYTYNVSGNNFIIKTTSGTTTLVGAKNKDLNINGKGINGVSEKISPQEVIKKFMRSLDTAPASDVTTMLNNAIKAVSKYSTIDDVIKDMVNDCKNYGNNWEAFLKEKCDIVLTNDDTGAITGYDAHGATTQKNASTIIPESGSVDRNFTDNYFYLDGLNVYLAKRVYNTTNPDLYSISVINYDDDDLNETKRYIWQALRSWWLPGVLKVIAESYGENFSFNQKSSSTILDNILCVTFYNNPDSSTIASVGLLTGSDNIWRNSTGDIVGYLELSINMNYYDDLIIGDPDGKSTSFEEIGLDRILAHEFVHATMDANIKYATGENGLPQFIKDGMAELVHGIDDFRKEDLIAYASDFTVLENALDVDKLYNHYPAYACGYMFLRYIAKKFSTYANDTTSYSDRAVTNPNFLSDGLTRDGTLLKATTAFTSNTIKLSDYYGAVSKVDATKLGTTVEIRGSTSNDSLKSGKGADKIFGGVGNDSLWGGKGNDKLYGGSGNDRIYGEAGNDTLHGGLGNNTLSGGAGNDVFSYEGGKDIITDYTPGKDKIEILSGSITKTTVSGDDLILTTKDGSITIQNGKDKQITIIDSEGNETPQIYEATLQTVNNSTPSPITLADTVKNVDASTRTTAVKITGNALANSIVGGKDSNTLLGGKGNDTILGGSKNDSLNGGADNDILIGDKGNDILLGGKGNDSLWGGAGNDTFTGNAGNDFFIYEAGKDVISDYTAGQDKIQIASGTISKTSLSGSDVLFTIGKGSLTVKNAKGKTISLIDSAGKASSTLVGAQALTNGNKASVTIAADMGAVDASSRTKAIKITGNALANSISGGTKNDSLFGAAGNDSILGNAGSDKLYGDAGNDIIYGGKGNDSFWGGKGNDSLWGDAGNDTFFYTANEGTDKIFDYATGDMLKILNADGSDGSFKSSKFSGGDLTLTINGGGKIIFDDVALTTKFNINGLSYNISGSKLVKK